MFTVWIMKMACNISICLGVSLQKYTELFAGQNSTSKTLNVEAASPQFQLVLLIQ